jgi:hypothetical protein
VLDVKSSMSRAEDPFAKKFDPYDSDVQELKNWADTKVSK